MKRKLMLLITLAVMLCAVSSTAQINLSEPLSTVELTPSDSAYLEEYRSLSHAKRVDRAWLHTISRNSYTHPNPDSVEAGDVLLTPIGTYCYAEYGGRNSMWRAAQLFDDVMVEPYLSGRLPVAAPRVSPTNPIASSIPDYTQSSPWPFRLLVGVMVALAALLVWLLFGRSNKFVRRPPDFRTASDAAVMPVAEMALQTALGRSVQIVGPVERGFINGEQVMFYANGSSRRETYVNEPGFRTRVRFPNGQERTVVCRWACFNPCWSASDSSFHGTFMPQGSQVAQQIPAITNEGVDAVIRTISAGEGNVSPELIPADTVSKTVAVPETASVELPDGTMELTELRISTDKGITMIGKFRLTVQQLNDLTFQITGRRETDGKTKRGKDAKKSNPAS